ncbi:MAG: hypothetical protein KA085_19320 [Phenylobacterium sp.]|uniref:hypothetical protein n=1 Tax=Phenylobacterium sp. TaxID=1871053 RepID=UPI001B4113B4|nr:hypothetical protein [Phenylobacterium sp.]MBP7818273.1 hypothetical protein [Phenylobacterium sp.]
MRDLLGLHATALAVLVALAPLAVAHAAPAAPASCLALQTGANAALGVASTVALGPVSYPGQADAPGCTITFTGSGKVFGTSFQAVAAKLDAMMQGRGWAPDNNAAADGPTGTAMGYRKGEAAVAVSVNYNTAKGVCSPDAPVASCHPTAAQMRYAITLGLTPAS